MNKQIPLQSFTASLPATSMYLPSGQSENGTKNAHKYTREIENAIQPQDISIFNNTKNKSIPKYFFAHNKSFSHFTTQKKQSKNNLRIVKRT